MKIRNKKMELFRIFVDILVVVFGAYLVLGLILYVRQPSILYYPERQVYSTPAQLGLEFEDVIFKTDDGLLLNGWFIPVADAEFTVLFCHGNAGNIMHRLDSINIFCNLGLNCFVFDYRGYGKSQGKPGEQGTYTDAAAAYKWLTDVKEVSPDDIIVFGRSLGATIAAHVAANTAVKGLVIESAFTSYVDMGRKFYPYLPVRLFARFSYPTIDYVKSTDCPVMIIHSKNDELIPYEFGVRLYEAANEPKKFVEIFGSHNEGFWVSVEIYKKAWIDWLKFLKGYKRQSVRQQSP